MQLLSRKKSVFSFKNRSRTGKTDNFSSLGQGYIVFSLPGQSPGRAIILPPALALAFASSSALAASGLSKC